MGLNIVLYIDILHVEIFYTQLCVNIIAFTVNTCRFTNVFTVITTKDESGGIYNSHSTGSQGFTAMVNKSCPWAIHPQTQSVYCHKSIPAAVLKLNRRCLVVQ